MSEISDGIQYLYSNFIMRDLLSFVTPGAIVVGSLLLLHWEPSLILDFLKSIPFVLYIPIFGILYMVGFAVQCLGAEFIPIIKFHHCKTDKEHFMLLAKLHTIDREKAMSTHERFVVLKQMCGNGAFAILIAGVLLAIKLWKSDLSHWALVIMVALLIISLLKGHKVHVQRQEEWESAILQTTDDNC